MYRVAPCLQPMDPSAAEPWHSSSSLHTGATDGEVTGGGISPALPDAIVSLIWEKPRLIHPKNGHFLRVTDGLRNVFLCPFQRQIDGWVTCSPWKWENHMFFMII